MDLKLKTMNIDFLCFSGKLIVYLNLKTTNIISPTSVEVTIHLPFFIDASQLSWDFPLGTAEFVDAKRSIVWQVL